MARISVDPKKCKGCGLCILECPHNLISIGAQINDKGYAVAEQSNAFLCTGCTLCALVCPEDAITVYR